MIDPSRLSIQATLLDLAEGVVAKVVGKSTALDALTGAAKVGVGLATGDVFALIGGAKDIYQALTAPTPVECFSCKSPSRTQGCAPDIQAKLSQGWAQPSSSALQAAVQAATSRSPGPGDGSWDARFANSVDVLKNRFDLLDTAAGIGKRDGLIGKNDLQAALKNPDLPADVKDACRFLLNNSAAWNQLDVGAGIGGVDGLIGKNDLAAVSSPLASAKGAAAPVVGGLAAKGPSTSTTGSTPAIGGDASAEKSAEADKPAGIHGASPSRFAGTSVDQIIEEIMMGLLDKLDGERVDAAKALDSQGKNADGTEAPGAAKLQLKLQKVMEKCKEMFELLTNMSRLTHELAKTALGNMGRA